MAEGIETVRGVVERLNDKGLKLKGHEDWFNFSLPEYRDEPWDTPKKGDSVVLTVSGGKWIGSIKVTVQNTAPNAPEPPRAGTPPTVGDGADVFLRKWALEQAVKVGSAGSLDAAAILDITDAFLVFLTTGSAGEAIE